jgi:hypothetical protein
MWGDHEVGSPSVLGLLTLSGVPFEKILVLFRVAQARALQFSVSPRKKRRYVTKPQYARVRPEELFHGSMGILPDMIFVCTSYSVTDEPIPQY